MLRRGRLIAGSVPFGTLVAWRESYAEAVGQQEHQMPTTPERPKWLDDLITALGKEMGFEGFAFDDEDRIALDLEGIPVIVSQHADGACLILRSPLEYRPVPDAGLLALLHAANFHSLCQGNGIIACDYDGGSWVWTDRVAHAGLTAPQLRDRIEQGAAAARFWSAELPKLGAKSRAQDASRDSPSPSDPSDVIFRI